MIPIETSLMYGLIVVTGAIAGYIWREIPPEELIREWADRAGVELLRCDICRRDHGPFAWRTIEGQFVCRVVARFANGEIDSAWILCGSPLLGTLSRRVEVRWDAPPGFPVIVRGAK